VVLTPSKKLPLRVHVNMSTNILTQLLEKGLPSREVQVALSDVAGRETQIASQSTHDNLNMNANMQIGDADVSASNPVIIGVAVDDQIEPGSGTTGSVTTLKTDYKGRLLTVVHPGPRTRRVYNLGTTISSNNISASGSVLMTDPGSIVRIIISCTGITPGSDHYLYFVDSPYAVTDQVDVVLQINISSDGVTVVDVGFPTTYGLCVWHSTTHAGTASGLSNVLINVVADPYVYDTEPTVVS
jgi:hypothetical protein